MALERRFTWESNNLLLLRVIASERKGIIVGVTGRAHELGAEGSG